MLKLVYSSHAREDLAYWEATNKKIHNRIETLILAIRKNPFKGIGKPEPLKHNFKGFWSRRISDIHRIVYKVDNDTVYIAQCRYHY